MQNDSKVMSECQILCQIVIFSFLAHMLPMERAFSDVKASVNITIIK